MKIVCRFIVLKNFWLEKRLWYQTWVICYMYDSSCECNGENWYQLWNIPIDNELEHLNMLLGRRPFLDLISPFKLMIDYGISTHSWGGYVIYVWKRLFQQSSYLKTKLKCVHHQRSYKRLKLSAGTLISKKRAVI